MRWLIIILVIVTALMLGCAAYRPITDIHGVDVAAYEKDLRECQAYASQINPISDAAQQALAAAAIGAALGTIIGSFGHDSGRGLAAGASIGGLYGLTKGAEEAAKAQKEVVKRCLQGRGYKILY